MSESWLREPVSPLESVEGSDTENNQTDHIETSGEEIPVGETLIPFAMPADVVEADVVHNDETFVREIETSEQSSYRDPFNDRVNVDLSTVPPIASATSLFGHGEMEHLRTRWYEIQGKFVDEPRTAVMQADELVSEVIEQIAQMFANEHSLLESQWNQGSEVSTEDLRQALQHYRSFFNRLVV